MSIVEVNRKRRIAIDYYKTRLLSQGYVVTEEKDPIDLFARRDGEDLRIKIKVTNCKDNYFGAVTFLTWEEAFNNTDTFKFVMIWLNEDDEVISYQEYSPEELLPYSSIPPFKVNFSIPYDTKRINRRRKNKLTEKKNDAMRNFFRELSRM